MIDGRSYFIPSNLHSASCVLTKIHLRRAIALGQYLKRGATSEYGSPESAYSSVYFACGLQKVLPFDFEDLLVHHLPNKYVNRDRKAAYIGVKSLKAVLSRGI